MAKKKTYKTIQMKSIQERRSAVLLLAEDIPSKKFHQKSEDMVFAKFDSFYQGIMLTFKFDIPISIFTNRETIIDKQPFLLRRQSNGDFALVYELKKSVLDEAYSHNYEKIITSKVSSGSLVAKALIHLPAKRKPEKKSMSREEWLIRHPLQGGGFSPN